MQFSIIVPALNEVNCIGQCLAPLQSLRAEAEIILADGGSVDDTLSVAGPMVDKIITTRKGRARQMNAGAAAACGKILIFLHADTRLPEHALDLIRQGIQEGATWGRFNIRLSGGRPMLGVIAAMMNWRSRYTGIATGDQVMFIVRKSFIAAGGYPEIALMEDIALSKMLKTIQRPWCIPEAVTSSGRRWQNNGLLKTILLMWWLRLGYFFGVAPETLNYLYTRGVFWKRLSA